jgi:hypothetical protein
MNDQVAAGMELIGEFIDALDAKDRELTEGEKAYIALISEAVKHKEEEPEQS